MPSMNKVTVIGYLGKDAEMIYLKNGSPKISFSMATTEKWKENEEWKEKTEWHNIVFFGDRFEYIGELKKGNLVLIEGKIAYRSWDKDDGTKGYMTEIVGQMMKNFTYKEKSANAVPEDAYSEDKPLQSEKGNESPLPIEDLPF